MIKFFTVGVYGKSHGEFFGILSEYAIDTFVDIRRRRAVRGKAYSFVNSKQLQKSLSQLGIKYKHVIQLAPTKEIRLIQKLADVNASQNKSDRTALSPAFINAYRESILTTFDINKFAETLKIEGSKNVVLFCVEKSAEACHRSIVATKISASLNTVVYNI